MNCCCCWRWQIKTNSKSGNQNFASLVNNDLDRLPATCPRKNSEVVRREARILDLFRSSQVLYLVSYNVISGSNAAAAGKYEKYRLTFNFSFETIYPKLLISCRLGSGEVWLGSVHTWLALHHCTVLHCTVLYSMPRWREARCAARPPWPGWWRLCRLGTATLGPGTSNFI